jgi:hypothetical protein
MISRDGWDCVYGFHRPSTAAGIQAANKAAVAENPENEVVRVGGSARSAKGEGIEQTPLGAVDEKGIISTGRKWKPGRSIRIAFLGGHPTVRQRVQHAAMEWTNHANIKFQFVGEGEPGEVRIAFRPGGSWSLLGTDALAAPADQETMNYGWLNQDSDEPTVRSVVLHEFGHALGLIHEHQFTGPGRIVWNEPAAIAYYGRTQGWNPDMVRQQVLTPYAESDAATTAQVDKDSIMMYPIQAGIANIAVGWNTRLSPTDIDFIGRHYYPPPGLKPTLLTLGAEPTFGAVRGTQVAAYRFSAEHAGDYLVRVSGLPVEVLLLADGPRKLARGEAAVPRASLALGMELPPGEYTVHVRRKDPQGTGPGQFRISVSKPR